MAIPLIPRKILFGNPDKASVQLSPDGSQIAYQVGAVTHASFGLRQRAVSHRRLFNRMDVICPPSLLAFP